MSLFRKSMAVLLCAVLPVLLMITASAASSANGFGLISRNKWQETGDELLLIQRTQNEDMEAAVNRLYTSAAPNTVSSLKTVPTAGIITLSLTAGAFGVVIEPTGQPDFIIDFVGVKEPGQVQVTVAAEDSLLSVTVTGSLTENRLLSTVEDNRINVLRIGVPSDTLEQIQIKEEGNSCILLNGLDIPVTGSVQNGTVRLQGGALTAPISLEGSRGDLLVVAQRVEGPVSMSVSSGDIVLMSGNVTGKVELAATSGDITVDAGRLQNAVLTATNGDIDARVGTIGGQVSASVTSGDLAFRLLEQPANLTFKLNSRAGQGDLLLPKGWKDGYTIGNGRPILHLGVGSGDLELKVG